MMRRSYTAVVERNVTWEGTFATEPYEAAWASEAIFFVRVLSSTEGGIAHTARVQISPDGMHWCDEGTVVTLPTEKDGVAFARVREFGGWLRLAGETEPGAPVTVIAYLALKG